jgi:hypothetical protein
MKTQTCDACGKEIGQDNPPAPTGQQQRSRIMVGSKNLAFYFEFRIAAFEVEHPDLCQRCLFNALANPAPEPTPPAAPAAPEPKPEPVKES